MTIKLTEPQRKMLIEAAADEDYASVSIGQFGPLCTAMKLEDLGLGRITFSGAKIFSTNAAGRRLAAELEDARRARSCPTCGLENPGPEHRAHEPLLCPERPLNRGATA